MQELGEKLAAAHEQVEHLAAAAGDAAHGGNGGPRSTYDAVQDGKGARGRGKRPTGGKDYANRGRAPHLPACSGYDCVRCAITRFPQHVDAVCRAG